MDDVRLTLIVFILTFFQLLYAEFYTVYNHHDDTIYDFSNATWTSNSPIPPEGVQTILFHYVYVPDSSLELLAQLLNKVRSFSFYYSTMSRILLPINLLKFTIINPLKPIEIVIASNGSYSLKELTVSQFVKLPTQVAHLKSLEHFYLSRTPVFELDFELLAKMENLTTFSMMRTSTKDIYFSEAHKFPLLKTFVVSINHLTTLNATSCNFPSLETLDLSTNKLVVLPNEIATFENLTHLCLQNNQIKSINMHIFTAFRKLVVLNLYNNHISSIKGELQLPKLSTLSLNTNRLEELDVSQWYLPAVKTIYLSNNLLNNVVGFTKCFGGAIFIYLNEGPWDCSWLKEVGRSIEGMYITYDHRNSTLHCSGYRYSMTERSLVETRTNGTSQIKEL